MSNMLKILGAFVCGLLMLATANAADMTNTANNPATANWQIDRWAEGAVQSIDAKNNKFTIRGHELAWSSEYAKMVKDIHDKTRDLAPAERMKKANDIRQSYADALAKARNENEKDADFTFYASKDSGYRFAAAELPGGHGPKTGAMQGVGDLKIGDHMTFGYGAGVMYNYVYDAIHGAASDTQLENMMNASLGDLAPAASH